MKESTLLEMQKKIKSLTNVIQHMFNENTQLKDLAVGTLEIIKLMPGYDEALDKLKESVNKKEEENGAVESDTK
jgi:hypothetical protein